MLDNRYKSFLTLCETLNYTKTAEKLFVTQPTVTQHIQYLEERYRTKLFNYKNKRLELTEKGSELRNYINQMNLNLMQIENRMLMNNKNITYRIGATKTIGEFVFPGVINTYLELHKDTDIDMYVDNTKVLLKMLNEGQLDFALLEGFFDKSAYDYRLLKRERFIGVCSPGSPYCGTRCKLDDLLNERIIVREEGSGTREIIERILQQYSLSLESFAHESQISNFAAIKELVKNNSGISFLYFPVVEKELHSGTLCTLDIEDFDIKREFNFVYPKNSLLKEEFLEFYRFCAGMM